MKYIAALGAVIVVGGGIVIVLNTLSVETATNDQKNTQEEQLEEPITQPSCMDIMQDEDACSAAEDVIYKKELQAELNALESDFEAIDAQYQADKEAYETRREELQKELGTYWTVKANLFREIRKTFPEDQAVAVAVAGGESGYNPREYNPEWHYNPYTGEKICQGSFGLMQIACVHKIDNPEELYDPEVNLAYAKRIYDDSEARRGNGWLPWGAYTDGGYKRHLSAR